MISISNLSKSFGSQVIFQNFSLDLPNAGCVCFFGPSGSGKTTLLNLLAGLLLPDSGTISFPAKSKLSFAFQEDRLLPWISAEDNVRLVLGNGKDARVIAERWLREVSLEKSADKLPPELSGGMRQRVALARSFAYGGDILLLDEPFQGIDAQAKDGIFSILSEMKKEKLIVLITHYPEEAVRLADVIHILGFPPVRILDTLAVSDENRHNPLTIKKLTAHFAGQPNIDTIQ